MQESPSTSATLLSPRASQNPRRKDAFKMACVRTGRDFMSRLRSTAGIKGQAGGSDTYTVGTSRHVAVALYTNSIMHARANINYYGFNIGRRRWPWPTTSWAKYVKCGKSPDVCKPRVAFSRFAREISPRDLTDTQLLQTVAHNEFSGRSHKIARESFWHGSINWKKKCLHVQIYFRCRFSQRLFFNCSLIQNYSL